jgi:phosphopantetheine adenylyltransferase
MKRKDYVDKTADDLIKKKESSEKLLAFANRASGLTSFLLNKSKEEILTKEAQKRIPDLKNKLLEKKEFFDKKTVKSDNIRILSKEITQCEEYLSKLGEEIKIEDLKLILDWYYKTSEKYGF